MFHTKNKDYAIALGRVKPTRKPKRVSYGISGSAWGDLDDNTHCGSLRYADNMFLKYSKNYTSLVETFLGSMRWRGITFYQVKYVDYTEVAKYWVPAERFQEGPNRLKLRRHLYRLGREKEKELYGTKKSLRIMAKGRRDYRIMSGKPGRKRRRVIQNKKNVFQLETILDKEMGPNGQYLFFIKWQGWSESDNTWEPGQNLYGCRKELQAFEQFWHERQKIEPGEELKVGNLNRAMP